MARGENATQKRNREYWGKREGRRGISQAWVSHRPGTNALTKALTHRAERLWAKNQLRVRLHDPDWGPHPDDTWWEGEGFYWRLADDIPQDLDGYDERWDDSDDDWDALDHEDWRLEDEVGFLNDDDYDPFDDPYDRYYDDWRSDWAA